MQTHSSSLPAKRARCGGRGPPMVVGKPSPVSAVVSGVSVGGGTGGATCKWKSQGSISNFPFTGTSEFFSTSSLHAAPPLSILISLLSVTIKLSSSHFRYKRQE